MPPRIMVIGAGRMGALRASDLAPLVDDLFIVNRSPEPARAVAREHGATAVPLAEALDVEVDAYVVATATAAHGDLLRELLPLGRPILCEKPIGATLGETEAIIEAAREHDCRIQVGFQRRFDPEFARARELVSSGDVGTLYSVRIVSHDHEPSEPDFIASSGGIFRDLHVHDFDLIRWLTGSSIERVYATSAVRTFTRYADHDDADVTSIQLVTTSGVQASVSGARHDPRGHDVRMEVFGSEDSLAAGLDTHTPLRPLGPPTIGAPTIGSDPWPGFVPRFREAFRREAAAFVAHVRGDAPNPAPPEAALESTRVAIACELSVQRGVPVTVAEVLSDHEPASPAGPAPREVST